jgi:tRNA 5-methylaminomethyl-2-thiouridine biosynthesis bifunctional protein
VSAGLELGSDGRARSTRYDDMYQPDIDGAQARAVFLAGNGLPERFAGHAGVFTVLELGFGTGLNFLETWRAWRSVDARCALSYIGIDAHPLTRAEARAVAMARARAAHGSSHDRTSATEDRALAEDVSALVAAWPEVWPRVESLPQSITLSALDSRPVRALRLTLVNDTFDHALEALAESAPGSIDAVYLDGFAPAKNPSAWTDAVFAALGRATRFGGTAATWSVAGVARRGLASAGFTVERAQGHGAKRERLTAVRAPGV